MHMQAYRQCFGASLDRRQWRKWHAEETVLPCLFSFRPRPLPLRNHGDALRCTAWRLLNQAHIAVPLSSHTDTEILLLLHAHRVTINRVKRCLIRGCGATQRLILAYTIVSLSSATAES
jgi:hypothetical protein